MLRIFFILVLLCTSVCAQTPDERLSIGVIRTKEVCDDCGSTYFYGGTCYFIEPSYIVTCAHVIQPEFSGSCTFEVSTDLGVFNAYLIYANAYTDVAVLHGDIPQGVLKLKLADIGPKPGDFARILTNGGMIDFQCDEHVRDTIVKDVYSQCIRLDTWVQSGDSGCPILNSDGDVIGMNSNGEHPEVEKVAFWFDNSPAIAFKYGKATDLENLKLGVFESQKLIDGR